MKIFLILGLSIQCLGAFAVPQETVVKGCQCLDCPYYQQGQKNGIWLARKDIALVASPKAKDAVTIVKGGDRVVALSGELHNIPGELEVTFAHRHYKVGERVYITQEDADAGTWKLWANGKEDFDDLSKMVSEKQPCKVPSAECWAKINKNLVTIWWAQIQTKENKVGWTKEVGAFYFDRSSCM